MYKNLGTFKNFQFFFNLLKWIEGIISLSLRPYICQNRTYMHAKKKYIKIFSMSILILKKIEFIFLKIRCCSDEFSFETLFVRIGLDFSEIFGFVYLSAHGPSRRLFHNSTKNFESSLNCIQCPKPFIWAIVHHYRTCSMILILKILIVKILILIIPKSAFLKCFLSRTSKRISLENMRNIWLWSYDVRNLLLKLS